MAQGRPKLKSPQSIGLADAQVMAFYEPDPGRYLVEFTAPPVYQPADEEAETSERFTFKLRILEAELEDESAEDPTGRTWTYSIFIPAPGDEDDEDNSSSRWRRMALSQVKSIFEAAGVKVSKDKSGYDIWDPDEFVGKHSRLVCKYVIDRESGEIRKNSRGRPLKNYYFYKAPQEDAE